MAALGKKLYILVYMNLEEILKEARSEKIPVMLDDGIVFLCDFIKSNEDIHRILEIGTAVGYSAMQMAMIRPDIEIDTLEINAELADRAVHNIQDNHLEDRIHVHVTDAMAYQTDVIYDMIFVDAAKAQYAKYMEHFLKNTEKGSWFVFDNLQFHGMVDNPSLTRNRGTLQMLKKIRVFREQIQTDPRFNTEYFADKGDGIAISQVL